MKFLCATGGADCDALDLRVAGALRRQAYAASEGEAPHLARLALRSAPGEPRVQTTLRADLQRFAARTLQQHLRELRGRNVEDGAIVVLDNASGAVLAWVGSSGALSRAGEVDGVTALRQPGSTLKPFLYAQAIAERRLTAASLLEDSPAHIPTASGLYIPQNYDRRFKGWISVRTALGASLNVPAVRTLGMVSPDAFARQLAAAGLPLQKPGEHYGYSLALGSAEVRLLDLTTAYRSLANGGRFSATHWRADRIAPRETRQAIDPAAAFIVADILADPNARARTFGTDSLLATRFWTAVKTGTSKDMRDNWAIGWSQRYTVGVWVGNAGGAPMHDVSGSSGAAPVWADVMGYLHAREPSRAPRPPAGVARQQVKFGEALEAARAEWFLEGTQQERFALEAPDSGLRADDRTAARILVPQDGTIIALDPDIPPAHQRLALRAEGPASLRWRIDGRVVARGSEAGWLPWPGRHQLQLEDAHGHVLDAVKLEVRGAGVKASAR